SQSCVLLFFLFLFPSFVCLFDVGCAHQQTRLQAEDDSEREKEPEIQVIGNAISFANADPIPVTGVGLVVGLEGTGGGAPPGGLRTRLEADLRKRGIENIKQVLDSKDTSLVQVSGMVPPGARKGDTIDLEVTVPRESKASSLRGGHLLECELFNYDTAKHLNPNYAGVDRAFKGHPIARAEGPLLVGFNGGDEAAKFRQARIWGGGKCRVDRPLQIALNADKQSARMAQLIAERINLTFHGSSRGPETDLAVAETKAVVFLRVPSHYKLNLPRYLRVIRLIPLQESEAARLPYLRPR